ncbi:MAG: 50S ribosomal protein L13 [Candidatus Riflebacteria bacterium]|nr:50S ribosomal protein L13 [Candidatus Riflebacteria bacterium]
MKTFIPKPADNKQDWVLIDAKGLVLGRLASQVADLLRGKKKPTFTPNMDMGDFVVVINASSIKLTGQKATDKFLYRHTGYPGGLRKTAFGELRENKFPLDDMVHAAVKCMLPRNKLRKIFLRKLKVYPGAEHPHTAQQPKPVTLAI